MGYAFFIYVPRSAAGLHPYDSFIQKDTGECKVSTSNSESTGGMGFAAHYMEAHLKQSA